MYYLSEIIVTAILILGGFVTIFGTRDLPMFTNNGIPAARLWPFAIGILVLVLSALALLEHRRNASETKKPIDKESFKRAATFVLLFVVLVIGGSFTIGMIPGLGLFLLVSYLIYNNLKFPSAIAVTVGFLGVVWLALAKLLHINFPTGMF